MDRSRIPSPARSQGAPRTPKRYKPRGSASVGSPACSTSGRITAVIQDVDQVIQLKTHRRMSPLDPRHSILTDDTDIEEPRRKSWWKKLDESSKHVMEVLDDNQIVEINNVVEEFVNIDVLSQENKKNYTLDLPESSDGESISSIVIPQRKLFTLKENQPQNKFENLVGTRESTKLQKTNIEVPAPIAGPRNLFGQAQRQKSKPVFPAALLNLSPNKTVNKTREIVASEVNCPVRSLFGKRPTTKRKNMFADFIASESEEEIPEIQPRVFGFQRRIEQTRRSGSVTRLRDPSPTSSITTDIDMEDWKLLPSSTMVENQLELPTTPVKKARLSKLSEAKESEAGTNTSINKTKQSIKSVTSNNKSTTTLCKVLSETSKQIAINEKSPTDVLMSQEDQNDNDDDDIKLTMSDDEELSNDSNKRLLVANEENGSIGQNIQDDVESRINENTLTTSKSDRNICRFEENNIENNIPNIKEISLGDIQNVGENTCDYGKKGDKTIEKDRTDKIDGTENHMSNDEESSNDRNKQLLVANEENRSISQNIQNYVESSNNIKENTLITSKNDRNICQFEENNLENNIPNIKEISLGDIQNIGENTRENGKKGDKTIEKNRTDKIDGTENLSKEIQEKRTQQEQTKENDDESRISDNRNMKQEEIEANDEEDLPPEQVDDANLFKENQEKSIEQDESENYEEDPQSKKEDNQEISMKEGEQDVEDVNQSKELQYESIAEEEIDEEDPQSGQEEEEISKEQNESEVNDNNASESEAIQDESLEQDEEEENDEEDPQTEQEEEDEEVHLEESLEQDDGEENDEEDPQTEQEEEDEEVHLEESLEQSLEQDEAVENDEEDPKAEQEEEDEEVHLEESLEQDDGEENDEEDPQTEQEEEDEKVHVEKNKVEENDSDGNESEEIQEDSMEQDESEERDDNIQSDKEEFKDSIDPNQEEANVTVKSNKTINKTHDTTGQNRKRFSELKSPENILHDKTNEMESFMGQGRNTSIRKTKSIIRPNTRPSLDPIRESFGSDGTRNSSAEGSGWDSHRTTRKTLRQTFGKDFTPRKSLRALVMEKSAKRQTAVAEANAELSKFPLANSTELPDRSALNINDDIDEEYNHDISRRTRQTTLEMYLQKIKKQNFEKRIQMEEIVKNSLKPPQRDVLNRVANYALHRTKVKQSNTKPKSKTMKSVMSLAGLPQELIDDLKYKPPKRFQPRNAAWITKRLYKFFETKLEPKYDYKARIRAEQLMETLYNFTKDTRRKTVADNEAVEDLKLEMARLNIVQTHFEFYEFFHEYMPREIRIKVVPDIVNNIPKPRKGVFAEIIQDE